MRRPLALCMLLAVAATFAACRDGNGGATPTPAVPVVTDIRIADGKPIEIGVSAALSGEQAALGTDIADAAEMAVAEFGREIKGHAVSVVRKDDHCADPEQAVAVARELMRSRALAGVIGPMCTTGAQAANAVYAGAGVVHLSPSSTRIELSQEGDGYFFRIAWRDDAQAAIQARAVRASLGADSVVLIDDGEPYGTGLADAFATAFDAAGGTVLARERIMVGDTDFKSLAEQVLAANPAAVVFEGLNPEGALLVKQLRASGFGGGFVGPDGLLNARDFLIPAGDAAENALLTGGPTPEQAFVDRFNARYGRVPATPFVLQTYDAVRVLLDAIDATATEDEDGNLAARRDAVAAAVRAHSGPGLTGTIAFDENGDRRGESSRDLGLAVYRVIGQQFQRAD